MSHAAQQHRAELERHREIKAYYASLRRPTVERITFGLALLASLALAGRICGLWLYGYGQWLGLVYFLTFLAFVGLDSVFAKAHHPIPIPFGGFNPGRIYEKFAMQERAWQILLVMMLPVTARLVAIFLYS